MRCFIYSLIDPVSAEVRYIGKTINPKIRLSLHLCETKNTHKNQWLNQLRKLSLKPIMSIIEVIENSNDLDWQERERFWISHYRANGARLTNLDSGGRSGMLKSAETRAKMSASCKGRRLPPEAIAKMKATKASNMSPEVRRRMSEAQRGKKQSPETIEKRRQSLLGQRRSSETCARISASKRLGFALRRQAQTVGYN